ncbi:MAG: PEGA domain-containing protein [Deltaproteobacteria bacterium]|nr:PEGA domain-containing protein [Deltaproteobacteria bacterium]
MKPLAAALLLALPAFVAAQKQAPPAKPAATPKPTGIAPPARATSPADPTEQARANFRRGTELYREARYREAIAEFQEAMRLRPHGVIHFNLAQCHERLGDLPAALQAYHEYLRAVPNAEDRATVLSAMANLEARLAATGVQQLLVYTDPSSAEVLVNGQSRGRTPLALVLPHGSYTLTLVKAGYRTVTRQAVLSPRASVEIDVVLPRLQPGEVAAVPPSLGGGGQLPGASTPTPPSTATPTAPPTATAPQPPPPRPGPKPRLWTWVAAGASVAALGAGVYYGSAARKAQDELRDGTVRSSADAQRLRSDAESKARSANILYGVGAAAGVGAGALFFLEGKF